MCYNNYIYRFLLQILCYVQHTSIVGYTCSLYLYIQYMLFMEKIIITRIVNNHYTHISEYSGIGIGCQEEGWNPHPRKCGCDFGGVVYMLVVG